MWLMLLSILLGLFILQTIVIWKVYRERPLEAPQKVSIIDIKEDTINTYIYKFGLPALGASDVVKRELHVTQDGTETVYEITDMSATTYEVSLVEDQHVIVFLVDIDDAGNRSPNGMSLEFDVADIVPPNAPDAPTIIDVNVEN